MVIFTDMSAPALALAMARSTSLEGDETLRAVVGKVIVQVDGNVDPFAFAKQFSALPTYWMRIRGAMTWAQVVHLMTAGYDEAVCKSTTMVEKVAVLSVLLSLEQAILEYCK